MQFQEFDWLSGHFRSRSLAVISWYMSHYTMPGAPDYAQEN